MNAETTAPTNLPDEATARIQLNKLRDDLAIAVDNLSERASDVVDLVIKYRPSGLLTVDEIGKAVGRDRNYVDSVWSLHGETTKGKQTRVTVDNPDPNAARWAYESLVDAAANLVRATQIVKDVRAERNRVMSLVYAAKILGPSAIAAEVGVDRNHVLRVARKSGVAPVHRTDAKNQYTNA